MHFIIETGSNSSVSEIETPEVIETVATVSPDLTHEEIHRGKSVDVSTASQTNEIDAFETEASQGTLHQSPNQLTTNGELSGREQPQLSSTQSIAQNEDQEETESEDDGINDDIYIDVDFASRLDFSCLEESSRSMAPTIEDGRVVSYNTYDVSIVITINMTIIIDYLFFSSSDTTFNDQR